MIQKYKNSFIWFAIALSSLRGGVTLAKQESNFVRINSAKIDEKIQPVLPDQFARLDLENVHFRTGFSEKLNSSASCPNSTLASQSTTHRKDFYVVTAIFNAASFAQRYKLYHEFALYMEESQVQLMTVECIFPSLNQTEFQVTSSTNPLHVQLTSPSIYWVKENLINIAVSRLPKHAKWVAWLDADVYFERNDWVEVTILALKNYSVVQLFEFANFLGHDGEVLLREYSFGYSVVSHAPIKGPRTGDPHPHPGYAWAMSTSTFREIKGLLVDIIGNGDTYFAHSLINAVPLISYKFNRDFSKELIADSHELYKKLGEITKNDEKKGIVGYAPLVLNHKYHGSRKDRQYVQRGRIINAHNFCFSTQMTRIENGLVEFVGSGTTAIQTDIACYFESRNEDSKNVKGHSENCKRYKSLVEPESQRQKVTKRKIQDLKRIFTGIWTGMTGLWTAIVTIIF